MKLVEFKGEFCSVFFCVGELHRKTRCNKVSLIKGEVSKETVVLRRWGSCIQKFGFNGINERFSFN